MKALSAMVVTLLLQFFSTFSLADAPLQATKHFSEKTGQLNWDVNHQFKIEYIYSCEFPRYDEDLSGEPECSSRVLPVNKFREDGAIEAGYDVLINGDRLTASDYYLNENFQPIYKALQSGGKVVASIKNSSGILREVELDISDIERAGAIQKKIYIDSMKEDRDRRLILDERYERNIFIKNTLIPFILTSFVIVAAFFFLRSKYRKNRDIILFFAEKLRGWCLGLIRGFRAIVNKLRLPTIKYVERAGVSVGSELLALTKLREAGHLTEAEYQLLKLNLIKAAAEQSKSE